MSVSAKAKGTAAGSGKGAGAAGMMAAVVASRTGGAGVAAAPPAGVNGAEELEHALRQLIVAHEEMVRLAQAHRRAMAGADIGAMADCMNAQAAMVQRIGELERERQRAVAGLKAGAGGEKMTIVQLCRGLAAPIRERILAVAERLREVLNRLQQEHAALRAAAQELSGHMEGLMRQVCRKLSHAGTYGRGGHIDSSVTVVTSLDVRT